MPGVLQIQLGMSLCPLKGAAVQSETHSLLLLFLLLEGLAVATVTLPGLLELPSLPPSLPWPLLQNESLSPEGLEGSVSLPPDFW